MTTFDYIQLFRYFDIAKRKEEKITDHRFERSTAWKADIMKRSGITGHPFSRSVQINVAACSEDVFDLLRQINKRHMKMQTQKHQQVSI